MALRAGVAFVDIRPDFSDFGRQVNSGLNKELSGAGQQATKSLTAGFKQAATAAAGIFAGVQIKQFLSGAVSAASDLGEEMNKTSVVFGDAAAGIQDFSETTASALGISQREALAAAGVFGNLFRAMDIGEGASAQMSRRLVELAADLASFNNASPEEALQALRSGLVGEVEPLRRFGVQLSAARIEQEALNQGLVQAGEELDSAAKAQAAYSIILKDTTIAQGDFANTSGSLANQQRVLAAQFEELQASIGQVLLPAMNATVTAANDLLGVFLDLPAPVQAASVALAGVGAAGLAIGLLAPKIRLARTELEGLGIAGRNANRALTVLGRGAALAGLLGALDQIGSFFRGDTNINKLGEALTLFARDGEIAGELLSKFGGDIDEVASSIKAVQDIPENWWDRIFTGFEDVPDISKAKERVNALDDALAGLVQSGEGRAAAQIVEQLTAALRAQGADVDEVLGYLDDYEVAVANAGEATEDTGDKAEVAADDVLGLGFAFATAGEDASAFSKSVAGSITGMLDPLREVSATSGEISTRLVDDSRAVVDALRDRQDEERSALERRHQLEERALDDTRVTGEASRRRLEAARKDMRRRHEDEIYVLNQRQKAETDAAEATAQAQERRAAATQEANEASKIGFDEFADNLAGNIENVEEWVGDLEDLAKRGHVGLAQELAALGPEAAAIVDEATRRTDQELSELEGSFRRAGELAVNALSGELERRLGTFAELGRRLGITTVEAFDQQVAPAVLQTTVDALQTALDSLNPFVGAPVAGPSPVTGEPINRQHGGAVWPNQDFLVGEAGPERVRFQRPGVVFPNDKMTEVRSPDITMTNVFNEKIDPLHVGRQIAWALR